MRRRHPAPNHFYKAVSSAATTQRKSKHLCGLNRPDFTAMGFLAEFNLPQTGGEHK
jgi:hypothetical protein